METAKCGNSFYFFVNVQGLKNFVTVSSLEENYKFVQLAKSHSGFTTQEPPGLKRVFSRTKVRVAPEESTEVRPTELKT